MTLYNAKATADGFTITKFDNDLNPVSSYSLTRNGSDQTGIPLKCDCPASIPFCRHVKMLRTFEQGNAVNTGKFLDYETGGFSTPLGEQDE